MFYTFNTVLTFFKRVEKSYHDIFPYFLKHPPANPRMFANEMKDSLKDNTWPLKAKDDIDFLPYAAECIIKIQERAGIKG